MDGKLYFFFLKWKTTNTWSRRSKRKRRQKRKKEAEKITTEKLIEQNYAWCEARYACRVSVCVCVCVRQSVRQCSWPSVCVFLCNAKPGELEVLMTAHLAGQRRRWQTWKCKHELTHMSLSVCVRVSECLCVLMRVCLCVRADVCVW